MTMVRMAEELGVSRITVSAVINGREKQQRISPETAARVRDYLAMRGYVQSKSALQMKAGDSPNDVGILYCGAFMPFSHLADAFACLAAAIEQRSGIVDITGIAQEKLQSGLRDLVAKGVTRLVWIHAGSIETEIRNLETLRPLLERMTRVVCYNAGAREQYHDLPENMALVGFERDSAYVEVAECWRRRGHRKIALNELFFENHGGLPHTEQLRELFKQQDFEVFGLHPAGRMGMDDAIAAAIMAENLLHLHREHGVSCAFIRNEMQAALIMHKLLAVGIRVPEDIALIGFGYNPYLDLLPVPLTTFRHPVQEMCDWAIELLYSDTITGTGPSFHSRLVEGQSH